jgi:enamine deaminase RidA (YjgF/YER057c/UK114 family)
MQRRQINPPTVFDSQRYGFSQAVATTGGSLVHVSGQVGWDTDEQLAGRDLTTQMAKAPDNLEDVLAAAGGVLADVVALRIYTVQSAASDLAPATRTSFSSSSGSPYSSSPPSPS